MFIFTSHLGRVLLQNRLSRSGASGTITTVNGISTRSGFRDKKGGFSHQLYSLFRHFFSVGFIRNPLNRGEIWVTQRQKGGQADAFTPTLKLSATRWYLRMQTCITLLKSDKWILAAKAFSMKCLVFISLHRLLLRHKGLLLSMNVVTAWMTFWEQSGHPGLDSTDVEGWRWGRNPWGCSYLFKGENTSRSSGWMVNVFPKSWLQHLVNTLPGYICVCVGVLVCIQVNAHSHICMCNSIKEEHRNVICMSLSPKVWFQFTRGGVASEASCYADPQFSKEDNWLCSTISPSRWYTGQLWQSRTSSPAALPPPNLPDLNLLLPSREESWRVDTFEFHILHSVINSRSDWAWIQTARNNHKLSWCCNAVLQRDTLDELIRWSIDSFTINVIDKVKPPLLDTCQ